MHQFGDPDDMRNFRRRLFRKCRPVERRRRCPVSSAQSAITNTVGWTAEEIRARLAEVKKQLNWEKTTGTPRRWWEALERDTSLIPAIALRVAEELVARKATISEFFYETLFSGFDDLQLNLHYFDYVRSKKREGREKRRRSGLD